MFDTDITTDDFEYYINQDIQWAQGTLTDDHPIIRAPSNYYDFSGNSSNYLKDKGFCTSKNHGTKHGSISRTTGHLGNSNSAVKFNGSSAHIALSDRPCVRSSYDRGFTISLWVQVTKDLSTIPYTTEPFIANEIKEIIFANAYGERRVFGLKKIKELIGIDRYSPLSEKEWTYWPYNPADFSAENPGWFHLIIAFHAKHFELFVFKPSPDPLTGRKFNPWLGYFGLHNQPDVGSLSTQWGLGSKDAQPIKYLDEVRFYNWALSYTDALGLHAKETSSAGAARSAISVLAEDMIASTEGLVLFPNPSNQNSVTLAFHVEESQSVAVKFTDLLGNTLYQQYFAAHEGDNSFSIDGLSDFLTQGNYLVTCTTQDAIYTKKFIYNK